MTATIFILDLSVYRTHKIVGIATVSRQEHRVAQTRELECTKRVLPQVLKRGKDKDSVSTFSHYIVRVSNTVYCAQVSECLK